MPTITPDEGMTASVRLETVEVHRTLGPDIKTSRGRRSSGVGAAVSVFGVLGLAEYVK